MPAGCMVLAYVLGCSGPLLLCFICVSPSMATHVLRSRTGAWCKAWSDGYVLQTLVKLFCSQSIKETNQLVQPPRVPLALVSISSVDGSLGEVPSTASYGRGRHGDEVDSTDGHSSSHKILLCHLPRLGVELSRLELVVLADILAGLSPTPTDASVCVPLAGDPQCLHQENEAPTGALEVLVEARGATIVLHEAAAFAEDPGPHSYVLNLGNACLHLGGSEICVDGHAAPMVTVSSGDVCVHETLRRPREERSSVPGRRQITEPLIFLPGRNVSAYPSVEDLSTLGLVSFVFPIATL